MIARSQKGFKGLDEKCKLLHHVGLRFRAIMEGYIFTYKEVYTLTLPQWKKAGKWNGRWDFIGETLSLWGL